MADYISREAAIKYNNTCKRDCATCDFAIEGDSWCNGEIFVVNILGIPAADVAPVVHGGWITVTNGRGGHECNKCHNYAPSFQTGAEYLANYCPKCGAKMDLEEKT